MELVNGQYQVQGLALTDIAAEFGTPVYVYNAEKIIEQYHHLKGVFEVDVKLKYACKALSNINVLRLLKKEGAGCDAVSINEVKMALQAGFTPNDIMFTPNCVAFSEIEEAVELGVYINIDNIPFLHQFGKRYGNSVPICIRINPHITAGGNKNIQVGHVGSKFGISILQLQEIVEAVKEENLNVIGLHVHTGSDILDADIFLKGAKIVFDVAKNFPNLEFLDFGSGFKVAYYEGAHVTNIESVGKKMSEAFKNFCASYGKELEIWFEPGKFLVSESGYLLTTATLIKETPACTFIGVDSGFNHLIRPMMYDAHHDIVNLNNPNGEEKLYNVVGNICETDTFATDRDLPETNVGDIIAFKNGGAYGYSMSSTFNSRFRPAEVMIHRGKAQLIRQRDTYEDLMRGQVEIDL